MHTQEYRQKSHKNKRYTHTHSSTYTTNTCQRTWRSGLTALKIRRYDQDEHSILNTVEYSNQKDSTRAKLAIGIAPLAPDLRKFWIWHLVFLMAHIQQTRASVGHPESFFRKPSMPLFGSLLLWIIVSDIWCDQRNVYTHVIRVFSYNIFGINTHHPDYSSVGSRCTSCSKIKTQHNDRKKCCPIYTLEVHRAFHSNAFSCCHPLNTPWLVVRVTVQDQASESAARQNLTESLTNTEVKSEWHSQMTS